MKPYVLAALRNLIACSVYVLALSACGGGGSSSPPAPAPVINPPSPPPEPGPVSIPVQEVRAKPVKIAMVVSSAQMHANGGKIQLFADVLAGDLNRRSLARSGVNAAAYSVDILGAAADAKSVRYQLKPYDGAMLIGVVPVPLTVDGIDWLDKPLMDPFRLPSCSAYSFAADGNRLNEFPQVITSDPLCRHGMSVAVLRGQNLKSDLSDVERKLDQFIAYHRASDQSNLDWSPKFQYTWALWGGSAPYLTAETLTNIWPTMTLNGVLNNYPAPTFVTDGTAKVRKEAFVNCLASSGEMCVFGGHGNSTNILFEGPGLLNQHYSDDYVYMSSGEIRSNSANVKFVEMSACSSQDFLREGSFANALLMSGKTMLTYGSSTTSWGSSDFALLQAQEVYPYLALGASFAEAARGSMKGNALSMQGNPYISFRPVPAVAPKLVINGKHYNDGNFILPVTFPDSIAGSTSQAVLNLSNAGTVDLHIQLSWASEAWNVDNKDVPQGGFNGGLWLQDLFPNSGPNYGSPHGNQIFTIKPNDTMKVAYKMSPLVYNPAIAPLTGVQGATMQLFSDDPASYKITLDATMTVR